MIYEYNGSNLADGLYYFYAAWNSRCNMLLDRLRRLDAEFNIPIYKVNTTKYANLKRDLGITKMPTYLIIKNHQVTERKEGNFDYYTLKKWLMERMM